MSVMAKPLEDTNMLKSFCVDLYFSMLTNTPCLAFQYVIMCYQPAYGGQTCHNCLLASLHCTAHMADADKKQKLPTTLPFMDYLKFNNV